MCGIEHAIGTGDKESDIVIDTINIAGELANHGGGPLDVESINLSTSDSNSDAEKQGVRIILKGGFHTLENGQKRQQRAIVEFVCDPDREGTEGEFKGEDEYEPSEDPLRLRAVEEDDGNDDEGGDDDAPLEPIQLGGGKNASLVFNSYGAMDGDAAIDVLRLTWRTKYACENRRDDGGSDDPSRHWGLFTWLIIL